MMFLRSSLQYPLPPVMPLTCVGIKKSLPFGRPEPSYRNRAQHNKTTLDLHDGGLSGIEGADAIINLLVAHPTITQLILGNNDLGDDGAVALFDFLSSPVEEERIITEISLNSCKIGNKGLDALSGFIAGNGRNTLKSLFLQNNLFSPTSSSVALLTSALNTSVVKTLSFNSNRQLGDEFVLRFIPHLRTPHLHELHLSAMALTPSSVPLLAEFLTTDMTESSLNHVPGPCTGLPTTITRVRDLRLNGNALTLPCVRRIVTVLEQTNFSLLHLELFGNHLNFNMTNPPASPVTPESSSSNGSPTGGEKAEEPLLNWQAYNRALIQVFARNRMLTSSTKSAAINLLTPARCLLLPPSPARRNEKEFEGLRRDNNHTRSTFPWRLLPVELQLYILSLISPNLSPQQHIKIWNYASDRSTLPPLYSLPSSRPVDTLSSSLLSLHVDHKLPITTTISLSFPASTASGAVMTRTVPKTVPEWLLLVGCDRFEWYPGWKLGA